ncbi:hypothetical protein PC119_g443 [Phytophthora cactorum]|nr:hypothetical protein PC114_g329 [Phytophthora cactorum]KAG3041882.1 hypothetical protein PC119_g443 [Phytophthora cactorum]KAG4064801.1 hypothetical protein PC123_g283 [Phytophthora cactorum]
MQASCVDDTFAKFTGFGAAYLRAIESMRSDRIVNDPFPMRLTHQNRLDTRAYRLDSLRGCHVLEIDQNDQAFERINEVMKKDNVPGLDF